MGASMTASSSTLGMLLLLLFAACSLIHATEPKDDGDLVARVCAKATRHFCNIHLTIKYCVSTLRKDTRSARAARDTRGLALVAIDLARRGAAAADAKAAAALERKSSEDAKRGLRYCRSDFTAVERLTALCRDEVESYKDGAPRDVMGMYYNTECAAKLVSVGENCGHYSWFLGHEFGEALRKEFIDVARRTALVKAMVEAMIGMEDPVAGFDDEWDDDE